MTAAALAPARPVTLRPAPRHEPPFDDELDRSVPSAGPLDRRLPFAPLPPPRPAWAPAVTGSDGLPDPAGVARRLLVGLIEAAAGRRPLHQLAAFLSPSVHHGISTDLDRSGLAGTPHWLARASVRSMHVSRPADGVAELCATVETGTRLRAIALRLEERHGRWRCLRLQVG